MAFKNGLKFYTKDGQGITPFMIKHCYDATTKEPTSYFSTLYNDGGFNILFHGNLASCPDITDTTDRIIEFENGYKLVLTKDSEQVKGLFYHPDGTWIWSSGIYSFQTDPIRTFALGVWEYEYNGVYSNEGDFTLMPRSVDIDWINGSIPTTSQPNIYPLVPLNSTWTAPNLTNPLGFPGNYTIADTSNGILDVSPGIAIKKQNFTDFYLGATERPDPNEQGGISSGAGGGGNFDNSSDVIAFPTLPHISATGAGLVSLYSPNVTQMANFASFLWSNNFVDSVIKNFSQPMDNIINFGMLPLNIPTTLDTNVKVGGVSAGISMDRIGNQFMVFDCGSLDVSEYWGNCMDYAPHTKISIYCPFSGIQSISTDDIMDSIISLKYYIDLLSGSFNAMLASGDHVLYSWGGNMMLNCPISMTNWLGVYTGVADAGLNLISGGMSASVNPVSAMSGIMSTATNVMNSKPSYSRTGGLGSASAFLGCRTPYLIIERPRQSLAKNYSVFRGYPSNITETLGNLIGYTEVESVHLENMTATSAECDEIASLLSGGVIL